VSKSRSNGPYSGSQCHFKVLRLNEQARATARDMAGSHCQAAFFALYPSRAHVGPVAQWLEPAAHNGLVAGSSPARPTSHALDQTPFPESAISTDFSGGYRRATWNFGLTAGSFTPCGPKYALGLWRRFFSFRGRRRWLRQRPEFERPETGSNRRRVAAKGAGRPDGSNYRRALPVTSRSAARDGSGSIES
jgi:hypothetical protein